LVVKVSSRAMLAVTTMEAAFSGSWVMVSVEDEPVCGVMLPWLALHVRRDASMFAILVAVKGPMDSLIR